MESILLLTVLVLLILLGAPIGFTLILIPVVYILITDAAPMILIPSQMFSAIDSVPLTAIPFFMLTGELMTSATITDRLVDLSRKMIGRMRGSLAQVNVLVSMFFAGMNGSVVADTATVGSLLVPAMKRAGYPPAFAAAITAVSSTIGGIIPPSIMMIVLANASGVSVGALFAGGIVPGIMIGLLLMIINHIIAKRNGFERSAEAFSPKAIAVATYKSSLALLIPIVLVGSVVFGIAGVVEAGALTATIALFVGLFVYRTITWNNCKSAFVRAFRNSAMVFIIIAASGPFSWLLTSMGAINQLEDWLLSYTYNPLMFALVLVMFICLLGMVMDSAANIIVVGPVLVDVMVKAGYSDVQAALVVVVGFLIGSVTPPVGVAFFTAGAIAEVRLEKVALAMLPYLVALFALLFVLIVVPEITMYLPRAFGFVN
ncbi:TRAP dicarboxylate transporter, DctM subunit (plasmid) [Ruegeria pomeroyi DSS-3]|uniref:TRAP transporter large permease protein n=2 Tax=Ruegeria pomeroyi TaxID=89184 RepID=Q5LKK8_RUEPO|nr:TRAP transporter large permease [Ruegeria pomeroyi]AAV97505.1 TRAP dicarboxylate transporter, DctM subunit [Ruegeria pomeroyi DSS-3]NVK97839.1 TRAP transporter large permease [Ruegeria pomeroyi]NVL01365.1 TRAP transporter large permease [Ruegeria pomeroyi]HCE71031.1 TRAP transporter large permease [Ruegeria sp.]